MRKVKKASFSLDFVLHRDNLLYRIEAEFLPVADDNPNVKVKVDKVVIKPKDSYEKCIKRFTKKDYLEENKYLLELDEISKSACWFFIYPSDFNSIKIHNEEENFLSILNYTLRSLDPSIKEVVKLDGVEDSYVIKTKYKDLLVQDGQVIKESLLSSGTKSGLDIARMIAAIKNGRNGFYYCDEKFSYVHSDIEKAFIITMINSLKTNDQIFFTTHNLDVLDINLPKHSYTFIKKDMLDEVQPIKTVCASDFLKRNTESLRNAIDNDFLSISPCVDLIYDIEKL